MHKSICNQAFTEYSSLPCYSLQMSTLQLLNLDHKYIEIHIEYYKKLIYNFN